MPPPSGNADRVLHPHGIFPCAGEDAWVAIAVRDEEDWCALCAAIGREDLRERRGERDLIDRALEAWTRAHAPAEVETVLQARGIPAHAVLDTPGLFACPQLQHRGHFVEIAHEIFGTTTIESSRLRFSRARERVPESAIGFGA